MRGVQFRDGGLIVFDKPRRLVEQVERYSRRATEGSFHCLVVGAAAGDGITEVCGEIERTARIHLNDVHRVTGAGPDRLALAGVLPTDAIIQAARAAGLAAATPVRRPWVKVAVATAAAFLAAALAQLAGAMVGDGKQVTIGAASHAATNPWVLAAAAMAGLLAVLAALLSLQRPDRADVLTPLTAFLRSPGGAEGTPQRRSLVASLTTALLHLRQPYGLVVDDFTRLDTLTAEVLQAALHGATRRLGAVWVIVETALPAVGLPLRRWVLERRAGAPAPAALRNDVMLLFDLEYLDEAARREVADRAGLPQRFTYLVIKEIRDPGGAAQAFAAAWPPSSATASSARHDAMELLYLLGYREPTPMATPFSTKQLPADLAGAGPQQELLSRLLSGAVPGVDPLSRRLAAMRTLFPTVVRPTEQDDDLVQLSHAAHDALADRDLEYRLSRPEHVQLFWVLYEHARHGIVDELAWLSRQAYHLGAAEAPWVIAGPQLSGQVGAAFSAALLDAIDAGLRLGVPATATELLNRAFELATAAGAPLDPAAIWLLARHAIALTADPDLVTRVAGSVTDADTADTDTSADPMPAATELLELWAQVAPQSAALAGLPPRGVLADLRADATMQATWLALSLRRLIHHLPASLPLARSVASAPAALPVLAHQVLTTAEQHAATAGQAHTADLISVGVAVWCGTLADPSLTQAGPDFGEIVERALRLGQSALLAIEDGGSGARADIPRSVAAHELLTTVVAAAARTRLTRSELAEPTQARLDTAIRAASRALVLPVPAGSAMPISTSALHATGRAAIQRMGTLQGLWAALGFSLPAATVATRRAQYAAGLPADPATVTAPAVTFEEFSRRLDAEPEMLHDGGRLPRVLIPGRIRNQGDRNRHDLLGLIANLTAASPTRHQHVSAEIVAGAVARALAPEQWGEALTTQLCLLAIGLGHPHRGVDLGPHTRYLLEAPQDRSGATRLDTAMAAMAEADLDPAYLCMINISRRPALRDRAMTIVDALRRRRATVTDPAVATLLDGRLDIERLVRHIDTGQNVDVNVELDRWQPRRDHPGYPYVLVLLADLRPADPDGLLTGEIVGTLAQPEQYLSETGLLLLANLAARFRGNQLPAEVIDAATLTEALRLAIDRSWYAVQIGVAVEALTHLSRLAPDLAQLCQNRKHQLIRAQLDLLDEKTLSRLLAQRRDADLLLRYWNTFGAMVPSGNIAPYQRDPDRIRDLIGDPGPAFADPLKRVVSERFLAALREMVDPNADTVSTVAERDRLQDAARAALSPLLDLIRRTLPLPPDITAVLDRHRKTIGHR